MGGGSGIDRNGAQWNEDYEARGSRDEKVHHKLQKFNGLGLMRFPLFK
jgi:hypothetical protein